jgi:glycerophosphoryl diester phosphodiesterase
MSEKKSMNHIDDTNMNIKRENGWLIWFLIAFINLLIIEAIVLGIEPMWGDFNLYLGDFLGVSNVNYVLILILIIAIPLIYCGIALIIHALKFFRKKESHPSLIHKITTIAVAGFFDLLLIVLIVIFGEDAIIVAQLVLDSSIYIFMILTVGLIALIPYFYSKIKKFSKKEDFTKLKGILILAILIASYIFVFSLPFWIVPPNVVDKVPDKPKIIAHRGFSHIAPENTHIAWQLALENGSDGIEIDVQISNDGKLFLMHDDTLKKSTNVEEIFPNRKDADSSSFNLSELKMLNAGSWFVNLDPYRAISKGLINQTLIDYYKVNVTIPTLQEAVNFCRDNNLILDVDFKYPPNSHPYYDQFFNLTLSTINDTGINNSLVWITSYSINSLNIVKNLYPDMVTAFSIDAQNPPTVEDFLATGFDMLNSHQGIPANTLKEYYAAGIKINLWTVDIPAGFSQLWCLGATYITTNEQHNFVNLTEPLWYLNSVSYNSIWFVVYIIGFSCTFIYIYTSETSSKNGSEGSESS